MYLSCDMISLSVSLSLSLSLFPSPFTLPVPPTPPHHLLTTSNYFCIHLCFIIVIPQSTFLHSFPTHFTKAKVIIIVYVCMYICIQAEAHPDLLWVQKSSKHRGIKIKDVASMIKLPIRKYVIFYTIFLSTHTHYRH